MSTKARHPVIGQLNAAPMPALIPLATIDPPLVEALLDAAFGTDRHQRTAYKIREGTAMLEGLSLAAVDEDENELLGSLQCWPVALTDADGKAHPLIMVGPVAVHPACQSEGIGQMLMKGLMKEVSGNSALPMVMIGDPEYYDRFFGFSAAQTAGWTLPGPWEKSRLLAKIPDGSHIPEEGKLGPWQ